MVLDHRISRRQLLKSGAAGAAAATLATIGPTVALGAGKRSSSRTTRSARSRSPNVTSLAGSASRRGRRWAWRRRWATSAARRLPRRPHRPRAPRAATRRLARAVRVPGRVGITRSSSPATARTPPTRAGRHHPAPGGVTTPESRAATSPTGERCAASSTSSVSRRSATTASSRTPGPGGSAGGNVDQRLRTLPDRLEFASILGMPYMGTGNDPTSANDRNLEPWTIAGEKWEALNGISSCWGSISTRTTTRRPTTSSRTARWSP